MFVHFSPFHSTPTTITSTPYGPSYSSVVPPRPCVPIVVGGLTISHFWGMMMALGKLHLLLMFIHGIAAFINRDVKLPPFTHNKITRGYYRHLLFACRFPRSQSTYSQTTTREFKGLQYRKPQVVD